VSGLFQRALDMKNHNQPEPDPQDEFVMDEKSGISKEDQQEILQEIEKVSKQSRIAVTPETMTVAAAKKGVLFPLLVNIFAVVLLAGGGFTLYYLFQRGETVMMAEGSAITSAEGRLIEEFKKESEAKLLEKNREISQIQSRLQDIDQQRQDLQANMNAKIEAKEAELREALDAELAAERESLRQQGFSEQDIDQRLQELETQKTAAFQQDLEIFKRQAEEERLQTEQNLQDLRSEYEQSLAQANAERQRVLEESMKREAELRSQLDARAEELEQETLQAREELNRLAAQQEKETLAASQLNGFYLRVRNDIQNGNFDQALTDLDSIREYLDDPSVATLPNIMQRREIELFVVDSISNLVTTEMQKTEVDTSSIIASADLLNGIKNRIIEGDSLFDQGKIGAAEEKYTDALVLIPEIAKAHQYFLDKAEEAEQVRRQTLRDYLQAAQAASARQEYAAAVDGYTKALAYLPEDAATIEQMVAQVRRAGYELGSSQQRRQESADAAVPLARAENLYNQGDYKEAILGYLDLIAKHPRSTQVSAATAGINKSVAALEKKAAVAGTTASGTAVRGADTAALDTRELRQRVGELEKELQAKVALAETLQTEKQELEREIASLNEQVEQLRREQAAALENLDEELRKKITRLEGIEQRYNKLIHNYQEYADQEDALLQTGGQDALIQSKLYLNAFLTASEEEFPGLWKRIKRYDEAFEKAGRASAAEDVSDILFELSLRSRPEARELYLQSEKARFRDVPEMVNLIEDLDDLVG
jgi:tetratricopeptide (TPR) repeat protein